MVIAFWEDPLYIAGALNRHIWNLVAKTSSVIKWWDRQTDRLRFQTRDWLTLLWGSGSQANFLSSAILRTHSIVTLCSRGKGTLKSLALPHIALFLFGLFAQHRRPSLCIFGSSPALPRAGAALSMIKLWSSLFCTENHLSNRQNGTEILSLLVNAPQCSHGSITVVIRPQRWRRWRRRGRTRGGVSAQPLPHRVDLVRRSSC